jgi:hypothetical protein
MHLRRALLLFAIVLGLAALAAAVSRPANVDDEPTPTTPRAQAPASPTRSDKSERSAPEVIAFDAADPRARGLQVDQAATVVVEVGSAGMVAIPGLGVSEAAEPHTPAQFDVLATKPGRYAIEFEPADASEATRAGTLVVKPEET